MVADFVKPAVLEVIGESQYGAIPKSSTTMALIVEELENEKHAVCLGSRY